MKPFKLFLLALIVSVSHAAVAADVITAGWCQWDVKLSDHPKECPDQLAVVADVKALADDPLVIIIPPAVKALADDPLVIVIPPAARFDSPLPECGPASCPWVCPNGDRCPSSEG